MMEGIWHSIARLRLAPGRRCGWMRRLAHRPPAAVLGLSLPIQVERRQQAQEWKAALGAAERDGALGVAQADRQAPHAGLHVQRCAGSQRYTKAFKAALDRAGIENFHWHDLRHTFATWHRQAGTPTYELQKLGGWKTGAMVERYAHLAPEALQGAASRLDAISGYAAATPNRKGVSPK